MDAVDVRLRALQHDLRLGQQRGGVPGEDLRMQVDRAPGEQPRHGPGPGQLKHRPLSGYVHPSLARLALLPADDEPPVRAQAQTLIRVLAPDLPRGQIRDLAEPYP